MPTTDSGRAVTTAIWVTGMAEVLVASTASALQMRSSSAEHRLLHLELLEHRLDHDVGLGGGVEVDGRR